MDGMKSLPEGYRAVIIGETGGIGTAFKALLANDPACSEVIGYSRHSNPPLDVEKEETIAAAAAATIGNGTVHLIIDATGILHDASMSPEKTIDEIEPQSAARAFAINATGPILVLKHFYRLLPREGRSVFASLSARVGSISDNNLGGWYSYRASKAALNMFMRTAAIELSRKRPDALCVGLHPGTVETRLSDPFSRGREHFAPQDAAAKLLRVLDEADNSAHGRQLAYDGSIIPY
jgi:NAD(P)-dependent dehydrogenase (short-subunit alcohol dehydrogenase family)